jgi:hypothetical protein
VTPCAGTTTTTGTSANAGIPGVPAGGVQLSTVQEDAPPSPSQSEDGVDADADLPALGYTLNKFMVDNLLANLRVRDWSSYGPTAHRPNGPCTGCSVCPLHCSGSPNE